MKTKAIFMFKQVFKKCYSTITTTTTIYFTLVKCNERLALPMLILLKQKEFHPRGAHRAEVHGSLRKFPCSSLRPLFCATSIIPIGQTIADVSVVSIAANSMLK